MIRFCDLTGQIFPLSDTDTSFAFYDTVRDKFCEVAGSQCWDDRESFIQDFTRDINNPFKDDINRFLGKIPAAVPQIQQDLDVAVGV